MLCLFLLDMGLVAGRGLAQAGKTPGAAGTLAFGLVMPILGAAAALAGRAGAWACVRRAAMALFMVLGASASYIAVPAAMRVALPEANPSLSLSLALGITFPFNLTLGIPLYIAIAQSLTGG
ncbi:MAG: sodium-dependent bicarbonate transport family permease [Gemmobacter sp.]|nr:sodium-dependent bicarbonate transport family permease [Gemmobacter sp.]